MLVKAPSDRNFPLFTKEHCQYILSRVYLGQQLENIQFGKNKVFLKEKQYLALGIKKKMENINFKFFYF